MNLLGFPDRTDKCLCVRLCDLVLCKRLSGTFRFLSLASITSFLSRTSPQICSFWNFVKTHRPSVHHHHSMVPVSLPSSSLPLSVCPYCLACPLVCACPVGHPVLVLVLQTGDGRRTSACQDPAASLLLVFWAHRAILSICCTCQGGKVENEGMVSEGEKFPSLLICADLKIDSVLPFLNSLCISVSSYSAFFPVYPLLLSISPSFPCLFV